jgi:NAD(P)-dependent dehydrogenase (short-subunit alcohol dehydrogenase family)
MLNIMITGTNRGIGLELVRQYAQREDTFIFATCRQPDEADDLQRIAGAARGRVMVLTMDVANEHAIQLAAQAIRDQISTLDILINNAGINPPANTQAFGQAHAETIMEIWRVNSLGPLLVAQSVADLLRAEDGAKVVNMSSGMGSIGQKSRGGQYGYSASKAALNMISKLMANDLRPDGVISICLDPGWVKTRMGGTGATLEPFDSANGIIRVIEGLTMEDSGRYWRYDGEELPW